MQVKIRETKTEPAGVMVRQDLQQGISESGESEDIENFDEKLRKRTLKNFLLDLRDKIKIGKKTPANLQAGDPIYQYQEKIPIEIRDIVRIDPKNFAALKNSFEQWRNQWD